MSDNRLSFAKLFWPSFLAVFIAGLVGMVFFFLILGGVIGSFGDFGPEPLALQDKTVLHLKLSGQIQDESDESFDPTSFRLDRTMGLPEILIGLQEAASDAKIKGIFLEMRNPSMGMATAEELRMALLDFQKSGKFVVAYLTGEQVSQLDYYVSSACKEVYGMHGSSFIWSGLQAESFYFKNLLDELQIGVMVVRGKENDFKSAVEPFFLNKMSDSSRLQMQVILKDLWAQNRNDIAASRQLDTVAIDSLVNNLAVRNLDHAAQQKLLDQTMYRGEVLALLKKKVGIDENTPLRLQAFAKYARDTFHDHQLLARQERHIAVILAEGDVEAEGDQVSTQRMTKLLRQVRDNNEVKAVILRINSPGGSALASEEIWKEVALTAAKKTLYVSMGDYAASGGYYIAMPAVKIFANPMTITGSIGVFGVVPYAGDFFENKLGVTTDEVRTHRYGSLSLTKQLSPEELNFMQEEVDAIYLKFIERVSDGRHMTQEEIQQVARGRVWTGKAAQQCGLIDQLGGMHTAIQALQKKTGVSEVVFYPQQEDDTFSTILALLDEELEGEKSQSNAQIPQELLLYYQKYAQIMKMKGLQMRMPFTFSIH
ncbi:MAG: signal peptide peptidase SppA [Cryomorphaceae bacterium]|jgi:protease-4|nr:signal peptide peptidase SppA [Cryomorphaceae bacterium]